MGDEIIKPNRAAVVVFVDVPDAVENGEAADTAAHQIRRILINAGERANHGIQIPFRYPTGEDSSMTIRRVMEADMAIRNGYFITVPGAEAFRTPGY